MFALDYCKIFCDRLVSYEKLQCLQTVRVVKTVAQLVSVNSAHEINKNLCSYFSFKK